MLAASPAEPYPWPDLEENAAARHLLYIRNHRPSQRRSLHAPRRWCCIAMVLAMADTFALSERDTVLQLVPMFHANGWGIPFAAVMVGSKIVLSGRHLQPADIARTDRNRARHVHRRRPTLWMGLYGFCENEKHDISSLRSIACAGSALPRQFVEWYETKYGIRFMLAWGMTETTPIATVMALKRHLESLDGQGALRPAGAPWTAGRRSRRCESSMSGR